MKIKKYFYNISAFATGQALSKTFPTMSFLERGPQVRES
jgi:hypothetical protein